VAWTTPKTWAVNSAATSSDQNTYVRDNTNFLYGDTAWSAPTLQNSWVNFGGGFTNAGYRLNGTTVLVRGTIKNGTITSGTLLFTLPAGYRPTATHELVGYASGGTTWMAQIATNGQVTIGNGGNAAGITMDGMTFSVL
jgi:hypothetical protein